MYLHFKGKQWNFIKEPQFHGEINAGHNVSELAHHRDRTWERLTAFLNQSGQNPLATAGQNRGPLPCTYINTGQRGQGLERLGGQPEPYLGHKEHHQGDIGGENYGERGEGKGSILLAGQDHGDRGSDKA